MTEWKDGDIIDATIEHTTHDICNGLGQLIRTIHQWDAVVTYAQPSWRPDTASRIVGTGNTFQDALDQLVKAVGK